MRPPDPAPEQGRDSYSVVLRRRTGGWYLREWPVGSKYAAKKRRRRLASKYDDSYVLTIERTHAWDDRR